MGNANTRLRQQHGVLIINKPQGPTSAGCLEKIKKRLGQKKIGHAGTLDPMARGVLIVLLGQATKVAPYLTEGEKVYSGEILLGVTTDTYDLQGQVEKEKDPSTIDVAEVMREIQSWTSLKEQEVPPFSAAKYKGKPLYALKRAGKDVPVKKKAVTVSQAEVLDIALPRVSFKVSCSQGTYIRSLAHSLGKRLGCGAALASLLREQSHPFGLDQAFTLEEVLAEPDKLPERIISLRDCLPHWPKIRLDPEQTRLVKNGGRIKADAVALPGTSVTEPGQRAMFLSSEENPLALVESILDGDAVRWSILRGLWS